MADSGVSLYNRHRPSGFADLVGQGHVARALTNALDQGSPPRAYLFSGPRGTGKTTIARILARCLTCQAGDGPTATPCMECDACLKCGRSDWLDVVEVDAASSARRIDEMRDWLESVRYPPVAARYRVTIMDEAHQIQKDAASALLKTLEEPPPHLVVILCTTHPWEIIGTIRSRLQHYVLRRPSVVDLTSVLKRVATAEEIPATDEALDLVARAADGSYRDGLGLLEMLSAFGEGTIESEDVLSLLGGVSREMVADLVDAIAAGRSADAFLSLESALDGGADADQLMRALVAQLRHVCLLQQGAQPREEWGLTDAELDRVRAQASALDPARVIEALDLIADAQIRIRHGGADARLQLELVSAKLGRAVGGAVTTPPSGAPAQPAAVPAPPTAAPSPSEPQGAVPSPSAPEPPAPEPATESPVAVVGPGPAAPPEPVVDDLPEDPGPEWESQDSAPSESAPTESAPAEAPPAATPPPAPGGDPAAIWAAVVAELSEISPPLAGKLNGSTAERADDGGVAVLLPSEIQRDMLQRTSESGRIGQALSRHLGEPSVAVSFGVSEQAPAQSTAPRAPLNDDELHERLRTMFNATPEIQSETRKEP